jgi:rhodanese-related sulfurtransferase
MVRGCSEIGVLGPVVGAIGTLMAGETIKVVSRGGHLIGSDRPSDEGKAPIPHTMLLYNTYAADPRTMFRTITLRGRRKECVACGDDEALARKGLSRITVETITLGRLDYQAFCGVMEDVKVLDDGKRVDAKAFLASGKHGLVVDVREEHEYELGTKVDGSVNIPISKILRLGRGAFDQLERLRDGWAEPDLQSTISRIRPDRGMVNDEKHVPVKQGGVLEDRQQELAQPLRLAENGVGPDAGMVNQETHIPVSDGVGSDGGMVNTDSHIPVTRQKESDFPEPSQEIQAREEEEQEPSPMPVYFVCQRGNDSQIAAQRLIERVRTRDGPASSSTWGWIGDVKGGFLAMERFMGSTT